MYRKWKLYSPENHIGWFNVWNLLIINHDKLFEKWLRICFCLAGKRSCSEIHIQWLIPHSQIQLCGWYPHYLVVKSERDQKNPHFFDAAIISASGPDVGICERNSKIIQIISKVRSKITLFLHAHPSFGGCFLMGARKIKCRLFWGHIGWLNYPHYSYADNWGMLLWKGY